MRARDRRVGYLFQGYALFPHLTVEENIGFGLHRLSRRVRQARTAELIEALDLRGMERASPASLSGGQQQRVALGRALAADPDLLLLDEPLSALDAPLRHQLRHELAMTVRRFARTTVLVTHDVGEAFQLADRIVVYDRGQVVQSAPKDELLTRPASEQVARLLGVRNILSGNVDTVTPDLVRLTWQGYSICASNSRARPYPVTAGARVAFFIRAEDIRLVRKDRPTGDHTRHMNFLTGTVVDRVDMGTSFSLILAVAPVAGTHDQLPDRLEVDVPKTVYELLQISADPSWQVVIQPGAVQLLPN